MRRWYQVALRGCIVVGAGALLVGGFQNCAFEDRIEGEQPSVDVPVPYDFQPDTLAYLSCTGQIDDVDPRAVFSFYVASHNAGAGVKLSSSIQENLAGEGEYELELDEKLQLVTEAGRNLKLQLAVRSFGKPQRPLGYNQNLGGVHSYSSGELDNHKDFVKSLLRRPLQRLQQNHEGSNFTFRLLPFYAASDAQATELRKYLLGQRECGDEQDCRLALTYLDASDSCKHCPVGGDEQPEGLAFKLRFAKGFLYANTELRTYFPRRNNGCSYPLEVDNTERGVTLNRDDKVTCDDYNEYYADRGWDSTRASTEAAGMLASILENGDRPALCPGAYLNADFRVTVTQEGEGEGEGEGDDAERTHIVYMQRSAGHSSSVQYAGAEASFRIASVSKCQSRYFVGRAEDAMDWDGRAARFKVRTHTAPRRMLVRVEQQSFGSGSQPRPWQCLEGDRWMLVRNHDAPLRDVGFPCNFRERETGGADVDSWLNGQSNLSNSDKAAYRRLVNVWPSGVAFTKVDAKQKCVLLDDGTSRACYKSLQEFNESGDSVSVTYGGNEPFCGGFRVQEQGGGPWLDRYCPHYLSICHLSPAASL